MSLVLNILGLEIYSRHSNYDKQTFVYIGLKGEIWAEDKGFSGLVYLYSLKQWNYMRFPKEKYYCEGDKCQWQSFKKFRFWGWVNENKVARETEEQAEMQKQNQKGELSRKPKEELPAGRSDQHL